MVKKYKIVFDIEKYQNMVLDCKDGNQYDRLMTKLLKKFSSQEIMIAALIKLNNKEYQDIMKELEESEKKYMGDKNGT